MDRQFVLTAPDPHITREAVRQIADAFYDPAGGLIAQFEFGLGTQPDSACAVFDEWEKVAIESGKSIIS